MSHVDCIDGLGHCSDLVQFYENGIGNVFFNALGQDFGVGNKNIITDQLYFVSQLF